MSRLPAESSLVRGVVVVSTCNRFEVCADVVDGLDISGAEASAAFTVVSEIVADETGLDVAAVREAFEVMSGRDAVQHLFSVASGLESVAVGEGEIAGQVRRALTRAREAGTTSTVLDQVFQKASATSRGVQNSTRISRQGRSLVRLALDLAESQIADWASLDVLLVGTGAYAGASLAALRERGVEKVSVYSRSGRASRFAKREGVEVAHDLRDVVHTADVVVTCSTAENYILTPDLVDDSAEVFVIDLGLPRNVDPAVGDIENVTLLDLETIKIHAPLEELSATDDARAVVNAATEAFDDATREQTVTPAIIAYRQHVLGLVEAEIQRVRGRDEESTREIERALRHLASTLVHGPSVRARELAREGRGDEFVAALDAMHGIRPEPSKPVLPENFDADALRQAARTVGGDACPVKRPSQGV